MKLPNEIVKNMFVQLCTLADVTSVVPNEYSAVSQADPHRSDSTMITQCRLAHRRLDASSSLPRNPPAHGCMEEKSGED